MRLLEEALAGAEVGPTCAQATCRVATPTKTEHCETQAQVTPTKDPETQGASRRVSSSPGVLEGHQEQNSQQAEDVDQMDLQAQATVVALEADSLPMPQKEAEEERRGFGSQALGVEVTGATVAADSIVNKQDFHADTGDDGAANATGCSTAWSLEARRFVFVCLL